MIIYVLFLMSFPLKYVFKIIKIQCCRTSTNASTVAVIAWPHVVSTETLLRLLLMSLIFVLHVYLCLGKTLCQFVHVMTTHGYPVTRIQISKCRLRLNVQIVYGSCIALRPDTHCRHSIFLINVRLTCSLGSGQFNVDTFRKKYDAPI